MKRIDVIKTAYGFSLTKSYWEYVNTFLVNPFFLDTRSGDRSSDLVFDTKQIVKSHIIAKEGGIFLGKLEIEFLLNKSEVELSFSFNFEEGDEFKNGDILIDIVGDIREILRIERSVLNLLMRLCGVASFTQGIASKLDSGVFLAATRKTLWGALDKRAVHIGGGLSHRLNMSDAVIIKDTHLDFLKRDFEKFFAILSKKIAQISGLRFCEIEIENKNEFKFCCNHLVKFLKKYPSEVFILMFDNMTAKNISECLNSIEKSKYNNLLFEASGGIDRENYLSYSQSGVDVLSSSMLTQGVKSLDLSLKIVD